MPKVRRSRVRHVWMAWAATAATGFLLSIIVAMGFQVGAQLRCLHENERADGILVLSGDVQFHRVRYAAELMNTGRARHLFISGAGAGGDSSTVLTREAVSLGVPKEAIIQETRARSTYENILWTRPLLEAHGIRRLVVVTSDYHVLRAGLVARHLLEPMEVIMAPVKPPYGTVSARGVEALKTARYIALGRIPLTEIVR